MFDDRCRTKFLFYKISNLPLMVLKQFYEIKLQEQKIRIGVLEEEVRKLKRIKAKYEDKY